MPTPSLLEEIGRGPSLAGAACAGKAPLFDARAEDEPRSDYLARVRHASTICETCPVFNKCRQAIDASEPGTRRGIWAGHRFGRGA